VQRRRRIKAEPKNVFGPGSKTKSPKKATVRSNVQPIMPKPLPVPPSIPGAKPNPTPIPESPSQPVPDDDTASEPSAPEDQPSMEEEPLSTEEPSIVILEQQVLGELQRQPLGLSKPVLDSEPVEIKPSNGTSERAKKLIESSKARASAKEEKPVVTKVSAVTVSPKPQIKPKRKFRSRVSSYRPAARAKRLDRSRHMEYKYEMRTLLSELKIPEEHRSNLLATIWARGERLTTNESKEFLNEKLEEGIIDDEQRQALIIIVDNYTVRR
tara:strand:- start:193 stop:999 length:807 start_codon:yes stop_codon:yes gene_type:complete